MISGSQNLPSYLRIDTLQHLRREKAIFVCPPDFGQELGGLQFYCTAGEAIPYGPGPL